MAIRIRRRDFVVALVGAAAARPLAASAERPTAPVIGWLSPGSPETDVLRLSAFNQGLNEISRHIGRNVTIEYRWADGQNDRLPALAADLVHRSVNVIAAAGAAAAREAKAASVTVPIVFVTGIDPVVIGLVGSLSRPGHNITGVTDLTTELAPKQLEIMHEVVPSAARIALLVNPNNPNAESLSRELQAAASILGIEIHIAYVSSEREIDSALTALPQLRITGLVIGTDALFNSQSQQLAILTARHGLPAIHPLPEFAAAGGLMSYGGGLFDAYRQLGIYAARILNGEKPAELPVKQTTKFKLIINLKTAKVLGLDVPPTLLARADEVIE